MARQAAEPSSSPWSSLRPNVTAAVLRRLPSHADLVRFAAVCRPWRAAARKQLQTPQLPWLALPDGTFFSYPSPAAFRFPEAARYHGSCDDWLVFRDDHGRYMLLNPFSGETMRLPRLSSFRYIVHGSRRSGGMTKPLPVDIHDGLVLRKVLMCPGQVVVALIADDRQRSKVAVWLPAGMDDDGDDRWLLSAHDPWRGLRDLAFYDGKLHAVDAYGDLYARAVDETNSGEPYYDGEPMVCAANLVVAAPPRHCTAPASRYLVASGGRLLMVHRMPRDGDDDASEFEVFAADMAALRWTKVTAIGGDTALFVGQWSSVSRSVARYGLPGNVIHFLDDDVVDRKGERRRHGGFGSYDMVNGKTVPLLALSLPELRNGADTPMTWLFQRELDVATSLYDLSADVFRHVLSLLPSGADKMHLSQVCRDLRTAVRQEWRPRLSATAYLAIPNGTIFNYPDYHTKSRYHAEAATYRGAAAGGGWLLFYEDNEGLGLLRLFSPFTGKTMLLPSLLGIRACHEPVKIDASLSRGREQRWDEAETMAVQKVVVCPDGIVAALVGRDGRSKLALCSLDSFAWQFSARDRWRRYEDLALFRGRLYALTSGEDLIAFDYAVPGAGEPPRVTRVERVICGVHNIPPDAMDVVTVHYLVASRAGDDLLMVRRVFPPARLEQQRFSVFWARHAEWPGKWVEQRDLVGDTLFVGRQCSRAVAPGPPPAGVRGDEIFFLGDDCLGMVIWADRGRSRPLPSQYHTSVYDMRSRTVTNLQPRDLSREGPAPPTWIFFPDDQE